VWLAGKLKTPPLSLRARVSVGRLLRQLQRGERLRMPDSRPMPSIGPRCHELRVEDGGIAWRVFYRLDDDAVVILDVLEKKTGKAPTLWIVRCRLRARRYDRDSQEPR